MDLHFEKSVENILNKYDMGGAYYTSYPPVGNWPKQFTVKDYESALDDLFLKDKNTPLALYLHYPFCPELCTYCCCYVVISEDRERMETFSRHLLDEIDIFIDYFKRNSIIPNVKEIHLGGGSPNVMEKNELDPLVSKLSEFVDISSLDEFAIEIDVRTVNREKIEYFHSKGINRISFGIQDFNPDVQKAVNRVQPIGLIEDILTPDIRGLFKSINFDIMWGLPLQTRDTFKETIKTLKHFSPDRITLLRYGHSPDVYKHQTLINFSDIPSEIEKTMMNLEAIKDLEKNGYERIGIDHLAKTTDELAQLKSEKMLTRGFIGYPGKTKNLLGMGPSGLSNLNNCYAQNTYGLPEYFKSVKSKLFPVFRGCLLDEDLIIRRDVINHMLNYYRVDFHYIEKKHNIEFRSYFKRELGMLNELVDDGLIDLSDSSIMASSLGESFLPNICRVFDRFQRTGMNAPKPSSKKDSRLKATA
jgi:oxygen-independent coproporphyrinogen III oxidase